MVFVNPPQLKNLRVVCVGTYPPRRCGIGTFSQDLCTAISDELAEPESCEIVAIDDIPAGYAYDGQVRFEVEKENIVDYRRAADFLNIRRIDLVLVQHEFGIYGGGDGAHVLAMMRACRMPVIATLHTVLAHPSPGQRRVFTELIRQSDRLVVMAEAAKDILSSVYQVPPGKAVMIPHGIPDLPFVDPSFYKDQFGVAGRKVVLTFGLISPGKGIEHAIAALPRVILRHPEVVYIVLGATHPSVKRESGEEYRHALYRQAEDLGVLEHVMFVDRYVELTELCEFLCAADIYLTPYLGEQQIVSGTLAYALGAGKAVISTPYSYAKEMLADGRGVLVPFRDPAAIEEALLGLLDNEAEMQRMRKNAYVFTRDMVWKSVARRYVELGHQVLSERASNPKPLPKRTVQELALRNGMPELKLDYLRALTDDTGILQHARYSVPNRKHGYCTDDNARALIVALEAYRLTSAPELLGLLRVYLSFLDDAFDWEKDRFRNFMSYDRRWLEEVGSEDSHGRALWALGWAVALGPSDGIRAVAGELFDRALKAVPQFESPRAWAFALVGIHAYLRRYGGASEVRRVRELVAGQLFDAFQKNVGDDWVWPENSLNYANAVLPQALLLSGQWMSRGEMVEMGLRCLDWLCRAQTGQDGVFSPVGNDGWWLRGGPRAQFDQQPIEAQAMIDACVEAYRVTRDDVWVRQARRAFHWFLGKNDLGHALYDYETGGCRDGLAAGGVNENQGAESTLAWLASLLTIGSLSLAVDEQSPRLATA